MEGTRIEKAQRILEGVFGKIERELAVREKERPSPDEEVRGFVEELCRQTRRLSSKSIPGE